MRKIVAGLTIALDGVQDDWMQPAFVLVHSPSVGPLTWAPVADRLRARGHESIVPSLLDVAEAAAPFWPRVVEDVTAATRRLNPDRSVLLVAHSNAGLFVPLLVTHADRPVSGCLFVDAALPAPADSTPVVPAELLDLLRSKVTRAASAAAGVLRADSARARGLGHPPLRLPAVRTAVRRGGGRGPPPGMAGRGATWSASARDRRPRRRRRSAHWDGATPRSDTGVTTASSARRKHQQHSVERRPVKTHELLVSHTDRLAAKLIVT